MTVDIPQDPVDAVDRLRYGLSSSSTKSQLEALDAASAAITSKTGPSESPNTFQYDISQLFLPYFLTSYVRTFRGEVRRVAQNVLRQYISLWTRESWIVFEKFLLRESQKTLIAPNSAVVLLEWCTIVLEEIATSNLWNDAVPSLLYEASARLLDRCLQQEVREGLKAAARASARRGLRAVMSIDLKVRVSEQNRSAIPDIVSVLCIQHPHTFNSAYLGLVAEVASEQIHTKDRLAVDASKIVDFWIKHMLTSKSPLPHHQTVGLKAFWASGLVGQQDLSTTVIPAVEKAILRSPESSLQGPIAMIAECYNADQNMLHDVSSRLLKPLISAMSSANADIRTGAAQTLSAFVTRNAQAQEDLIHIVSEINANLKNTKAAGYELRGLLSNVLAQVTPSINISKEIVGAVTPTAAKEANESALRRQVNVLATHVPNGIEHGYLDRAAFDILLKGCAEKRPSFRKIWILGIGTILYSVKFVPAECEDFIRESLQLLQECFLEHSSSPLPAAQSGLISTAYVLPSLLQSTAVKAVDRKANFLKGDSILRPDSFMLNQKIYTKLQNIEDQRWNLRALLALTEFLSASSSCAKSDWARALIYLLTSSDSDPITRKETGIELSKKYLEAPELVGTSVVSGLWEVLRHHEYEKTKAVKAEDLVQNLGLDRVITCISPPKRIWQQAGMAFPQDILEEQAASTVVLLDPELIPGTSWIENCLLIGVDPGQLGKRKSALLLQQIMSHFDLSKMSRLTLIESAACRAAANLAFVAPDIIAPLIIEQLTEDLEIAQLEGITTTDAAIGRAPEGVAIVDPLAKTDGPVVQNKNVKDYNVLKWEEELRAQIAQKKGAPKKKLTAEQQAKVDAQMAHEKAVRERVRKISSRLRRGAGFVQALATGPPTEARLWMSPAIARIDAALSAGAALIVDDELITAYLACANEVQERIGSLRTFIGVAALRSIGSVGLPEAYEAEPLADLATRILYRLRFASEQRSFDTASVAYSLPLIFAILDNGGVGKMTNTEDADAQVLLALEFLSFQMSSCHDTCLPRIDILQRLIMSIRQYPQHYRLLRDSLTTFCQTVADNVTSTEVDVLLQACTLPETSARFAALQAIQSELELAEMQTSVHVWIACHDEDEDNAETALAIWEENNFTLHHSLIELLPDFITNKARSTRVAAAKALSQALESVTDQIADTRTRLQTLYVYEAQPIVPKRDKYGIVQKADLTDQWEKRSGLALAFKEMAGVLSPENVVAFAEFLVADGPLSDRHPTVRAEMLEAGSAVVTIQGKACLEPLMRLFETVLQSPDKATQESDWVNEAVIVLYGSLAQHLPAQDKRLTNVLDKLIGTLSTPSESVQYAVAERMPALVRAAASDSDSYVTLLLEQLLQSKQYAARRGAAYGLAGIMKGKGLGALRQFRIMSALHSAIENKKSAEQREGALFAYELFPLLLGRTFEPYIIEVLPQLLVSFGDPTQSVRAACLDTAKACFATLSSYGVHQVLPRLLEGLDETQWRSKKGACDLLGAMAYLDPQQLATSLPDIIPPLTAVLTDSHKEVRAAANSSLKRFGEVISNPEVKSLVDVLLKALSDPTKYTDDALDSLIKVSFVHYLDAPSLALVVRILERGLNDRSSTKRKAAQIIGSLAHLTEKRDIVTHLPILVAGLRIATVDPVPATRATASKALGSLVEKLGEDSFPDLIPSLMSSLRTDTGAGDRLGSAQALSEVLAGLGTSRLEETMPTILQNVQSTRATVREGFMTLFIFLPACFGNSFANYLGQIIPSILSGLADDIEAIRDIALRAGRLLVKNFATKAIDLLLPELQRGLADDSYRIRLSSVELVGDLLFSLTGVSGKAEADEGDESAAQAGQSLLEVLGEDRRNKVLSSLYICRCDTSGLVRAAAINVWKALVATPRTLREIVPTLTQMIIARLGSSNMEQKVIAGNALGEVIRKAGDNIFSSLLPSMEEELKTSTNPDNRQGICIALREVVNAASSDALLEHEKRLISIVRIALVDSNTHVREAAAESFDALQVVYGRRIIDQVLPSLLMLLRGKDAESALAALLTLLVEDTRANVILPNLVPTLLTEPISIFNARALASLAQVGASAMNRRIPAMLNALANNIVSTRDEETKTELNLAFTAVLCSVDEYDGLNTAMSVMLAIIKNDDHEKRAIAAHHLGLFFEKTRVDYSRYNQDLIRVLLISFADRDNVVVKEAWQALSQLQIHLRKEEMEKLAQPTSAILKQVGTPGHNLPGFSLPKGIQPVLQILLQALLNGSADQKLHAANGISDIIERTAAEALKNFVTQITGPLIRIVSERSVEVKCAIVNALNQLLGKIPTFLRPFLPQLQRTFTKCIADPGSEILRSRATKALSSLIMLTPRVDPLIAELVAGVKTPEASIRNAMMKALQEVVSRAGDKMSEQSRDTILALMDASDNSEDDMMVTMARLFGAMVKAVPPATAIQLIRARIIVEPPTYASILSLNAVLAEDATKLLPEFSNEIRAVILSGIQTRLPIQLHAVLAAGKFLLSGEVSGEREANTQLYQALDICRTPSTDIDVRRLILVVIRTVARHRSEDMQHHVAQIAVPVFSCVRDAVIPIKLAAESAFLELFDVVESDAARFDRYISTVTDPAVKRTMGDYFKRVALRLAAQKREQREAEGGAGGLGLSSDEQEDEREVWSVGRVDLDSSAAFET